MVDSIEEVNSEAVRFIEDILNKKMKVHQEEREEILNAILAIIIEENNKVLYKEITREEAKSVVF